MSYSIVISARLWKFIDEWSAEHLNLSLNTYEKLTEPLWKKDNIIIWPEAAVPKPLQEATAFIENLNEKAKTSGAHLILGIPIENQNQNAYHNAVVALGADKAVYLKRRLVPFGEYVPFEKISARIFDFMNVPMSNLIPGNISQPPITIGDVKILTSICYEIAFPELIRTQDESVGLLLTVTNDAWFGKSSAQAQHLQMAAMRAIELDRPLLFVGNDGITAIIGSDGKVESAVPPYVTAVLNGKVQPRVGTTPWMTNGKSPLLFILMCLLIVAVRTKKREPHGRTI